MAAPPVIEIREPGQPVRRVTLDRAIEVGRECDGELVNDPGVSRRHLKLVPSPTSLSVVDLGSANGTSKNGHPVTSRTTLEQGDIVRLGDTEIVVLARPVVAKPVAGSRGTVMIRTLGPVAIPKPPPPKPVEVAPSSGRKLRDRVPRRRDGPGPAGLPELHGAAAPHPACRCGSSSAGSASPPTWRSWSPCSSAPPAASSPSSR